MNIIFFCHSCGARFEVAPTSAGKKGRCKNCGQMMTIPRATELASMVAMPALAPEAVGAGAARPLRPGDSLGWLAAASSNVGLAPLTEDGMPAVRGRAPGKPKYDDDLGDSKPYLLAPPVLQTVRGHSSSKPANSFQMLWRKDLGIVQKLFRKINELAYLISVPFLMMVLLGAVIKNRPLALAGATAVVLLELGRIISGVANLAVVPFREGPLQGVLFLIPPMTFFYLYHHWQRVKKPTMRIIGPIVTIALIFLAFAIVPSLRKDKKLPSFRELEGEMAGEVEKAKKIDIQGLEKQALKSMGDAAGKVNSIGQPDQTP